MENEHTIASLIRKRAEIAGDLDAAQARVRQLVINIDSVDATIRLFAPDIDLQSIRPKPVPSRHIAYYGEISRAIMNALRETGHALTTQDLTLRLMAERSLNLADRKLCWTMQRRIGAALAHLRKRKIVESKHGAGRNLLWTLIPLSHPEPPE